MNILDWHQAKLFIEHALGISMDALHILVGFMLFLLAALLMRTHLASPRPWLALLVLELLNEGYDLHVERWPNIGSQLGEGVKDVLLTMALPTLILLIARWRPWWLVQPASRPPDAGRDANP
jgi:hypothetical protein